MLADIKIEGKDTTCITTFDCLYKHDPTCDDDEKERDDVENSNDVQGNVTWATGHLGFGEHIDCACIRETWITVEC